MFRVSGHTRRHDLDGISAQVVTVACQHLPTHSTASEKRSLMHWHHPLGGEVLGQAANSQPNVSPCKLNLFHGRRPKWVRQICPLWHATTAWVRYSWRRAGLTSENATTLWRGLLVNFSQHPKHKLILRGLGALAGMTRFNKLQLRTTTNTGGVLLKLPKKQESWEIPFIAQTSTRTTCVSMSCSFAGVKDS